MNARQKRGLRKIVEHVEKRLDEAKQSVRQLEAVLSSLKKADIYS